MSDTLGWRESLSANAPRQSRARFLCPFELKSTNVVKEFTRIQEHFRNIRGQEVALTPAFQCLEQQVAVFVTKEVIRSDDEVLQALAAAGLHAYDCATGRPRHGWDQLPEAVQQLAVNLTMTFDLNSNPELKAAADDIWTSGEEQERHFSEWGAVVRRLMGSVRLHQKRDPRGYCRFVVSFVGKWNHGNDDKVHWVLLTKKASEPILPQGQKSLRDSL